VSGTVLAWAPEAPEASQAVTLTAAASGTQPITFTWDFGDGGGGEGAQVTHTYGVSATYTLVLTAANPCGQEVVAESLAVVSACTPVSGAAFAWAPPAPEAGASVTFTAGASGTAPIAFAWAFGDGASGQGTVVTHTYALSGTYTAVLTASNRCEPGSVVQQTVQVVAASLPRIHLPLILK
jgi:PKD repeat protein